MTQTKKPFTKPAITFIPAGTEQHDRLLEAIRKEEPAHMPTIPETISQE